MFNSEFFAPAMLETTTGETWLELLPYVFIREADVDAPADDKIFVDFAAGPQFVSDTVHREAERHEVELDRDLLARTLRRVVDAANVTTRSALAHTDLDDPYFAPIVVAHLLFGRHVDSTGVPFIERGRQTFLNVEVALSDLDVEDDDSTYDATMGAAWLMPWSLMRPWDFYRPITVDDFWGWNLDPRIVENLRHQHEGEIETSIQAFRAIRNDNSRRMLFAALRADILNRPRHNWADDWHEPSALFDSRMWEVREARTTRLLEQLGFTQINDEWIFESAHEPPVAAFGVYGSAASEHAMQYVENVFRPRFRRFDVEGAWRLFEGTSRVLREGGPVDEAPVESVVLGSLVAQMALDSLKNQGIPLKALQWLAGRAQPDYRDGRSNNFDDTLIDQDFFVKRAESCLPIVQWLVRVTETEVQFSRFVFDALESLTDDELLIVGAFLFTQWNDDEIRDALHARFETRIGFEGSWKQVMSEIGYRAASIDFLEPTLETPTTQIEKTLAALKLDGKDSVAWSRLDRLEFRNTPGLSKKLSASTGELAVSDARAALAHEIAQHAVRNRATVTAVFTKGFDFTERGEFPGGVRVHARLDSGGPRLDLEWWDDAPSVAVDRLGYLVERDWLERQFEPGFGSAQLTWFPLERDDNETSILGQRERMVNILSSELTDCLGKVFEFASGIDWNRVVTFTDDDEADISLTARLRVLRAFAE